MDGRGWLGALAATAAAAAAAAAYATSGAGEATIVTNDARDANGAPTRWDTPGHAGTRRPRLGELLSRTREAGVGEAAIEAALDGDDPHAALMAALPPGEGADDGERRRQELAPLRVGALRQRAIEDSIEASAIEAALNSNDPRSALVALILGAAAPSHRHADGESSSEQLSGAMEHGE